MCSPIDIDSRGYSGCALRHAIKSVVARHYAWTGVVLFMLGLPLFINFGYRIPLKVLPANRQNAERLRLLQPGKFRQPSTNLSSLT